jgi:hypothetical protein
VELRLALPAHRRACDLDEKHLDEEQDAGGEQVAGVAGCAVVLDAEAGVNVGQEVVVLVVVPDRAAADSSDVSLARGLRPTLVQADLGTWPIAAAGCC